MAKRRSGCGTLLLLIIIAVLVFLVILLQNPKMFNRKQVNKVKNYISKIDKEQPIKELKNLEEKLLKEKGEKNVVSQKGDLNIDLYFAEYIKSQDKLKLVKVNRVIPNSDTPLTDTINLLLKGPSDKEERKGLSSLFPANVELLNAEVRNNVAYLSFNSEIESGMGISMLQARLFQIIYTATQFPNISSVQILINDRKKPTFSTEGLSIKSPLKRLREEPIF